MSVLSVAPNVLQLLEINLISAQDLAPVTKSMRAYAVAWLDPEHKLTSGIDEGGDTNPRWNEKLVFRVDEEFLNSENAAIMIEIYSSAWLRDVLVGTVGVLVSNVLPRGNRKSKMRHVTLQVRRPSGRPQGILNIGVSLVDSTMRSMPLYSELSASVVGYGDLIDLKERKSSLLEHSQSKINCEPVNPNLISLQRSQSEKTETTMDFYPNQKQGFMYNGGSTVLGESELGLPPYKGGLVNANGSLCSDVGPSPSVVAAAIAKGLYPVPACDAMGNSDFEDYHEKGADVLKTKMDRWRTDLPPIYDDLEYKKLKSHNRRTGQTPRRRGQNRGNGLCSCVGSAFGCEFSISFGGGNRKKKSGNNRKSQANQSELSIDESYV